MRFLLKLTTLSRGAILPLNYQYPLSSAIYKVISRADGEYAAFLHGEGYRKQNSLKRFKLFVFSDLNTPFDIHEDRMVLKTNEASLIVCFHMPEAATNFVKGLFQNQILEIADKKSKAAFTVSQVEALPLWDGPVQPNEIKQVILKPISPMVVGKTSEQGRYNFIFPSDERFIPGLKHHWREKYITVYGEESSGDFDIVQIEVLNADHAKSRLITIKAGTPEETKIRGFVNFQLKVIAPAKAIELAMNAGISIYGSMGLGGVEIKRERDLQD